MQIDRNEMKAYIVDKFVKEGDFEFLGERLPAMVDAMIELEQGYIEQLGGAVYDDDDAYELIFAKLQQTYPDYKMYAMRLAEDYLDFSEEYMVSAGLIEWE